MQLRPLFVAGALLRVLLLLLGLWQDAHSRIRYTDVDYDVFSDAARALARGGSPYERATYRYTPLLAGLLLPNVLLSPLLAPRLRAAALRSQAALAEALQAPAPSARAHTVETGEPSPER